MENNELKELISTFKEYRDLISPIEQNLRAFSISFDSIKQDVASLNSALDGSLQEKLEKIYNELSSQADKAKSLAGEVDRFMTSTARYVGAVDNLINVCNRIESKIGAVDDIEHKAERQIEKLNVIIEEKKKSYDVRQLEKNLEDYNVGVQKISQFINKDVGKVLEETSEKISTIQEKNNQIFEAISGEKGSIDKLVETYTTSNELLKKVVENNDINEEYIFEILDRWAEDRKIKYKR